MAQLTKAQVEELAEGLLKLQVRLNDLTIRLYTAAHKEEEMFLTKWKGPYPSDTRALELELNQKEEIAA